MTRRITVFYTIKSNMKTNEKKTVGLLALLMALCMPLTISCDREDDLSCITGAIYILDQEEE